MWATAVVVYGEILFRVTVVILLTEDICCADLVLVTVS